MDPAKIAKHVIDRITIDPETYDQVYWFASEITEETCDCPPFYAPHKHYLDDAGIEAILERGAFSTKSMRDCGTVACAAGHIVAAAIIENQQYVEDLVENTCYTTISVLAGEILQLNYTEIGYLFSGDRTKEQVLTALEQVKNRVNIIIPPKTQTSDLLSETENG